MQIIYLNNKVKKASRIRIAFKEDSSKYEYRYDEKHENKPTGGGWEKTDSGWSKERDTKEEDNKVDKKPEGDVEDKSPDNSSDKEYEKLFDSWKKEGFENEKIDMKADELEKMNPNVQITEGEKKPFNSLSDDEKKYVIQQLNEGKAFNDFKKPVENTRKLSIDEISDDAMIDFADNNIISYGELKKNKDVFEKHGRGGVSG